MAAIASGDVVIIPAVDRLSRDTTDLLVIARDMQRAGAGLRSLAEPVLDMAGMIRARTCLARVDNSGRIGNGSGRAQLPPSPASSIARLPGSAGISATASQSA
jgi:hypothetical protein